MESVKKDSKLTFMVNSETRATLEKLKKIHDRSMTGVIEQLIKREAKEYGLIEARE